MQQSALVQRMGFFVYDGVCNPEDIASRLAKCTSIMDFEIDPSHYVIAILMRADDFIQTTPVVASTQRPQLAPQQYHPRVTDFERSEEQLPAGSGSISAVNFQKINMRAE